MAHSKCPQYLQYGFSWHVDAGLISFFNHYNSIQPMRTTILIALFAIIFCLNSDAQSCLPDGISFGSQGEINDFPANYPGCKVIEGNVTINSLDIYNLDSLSAVTSMGSLLVASKVLTNLNGLENLTTVGGDITIFLNEALTSISSLENLQTVGGNFLIQNNPVLTSLNGLGNVKTIPGNFEVTWNAALTNLSGLQNLDTVAGNFIIHSNNSLTSLTGLGGLTKVGGVFSIQENPVLGNLGNLASLASLNDGLSIQSNNVLKNLNGLSQLTAIEGGLNIIDNPELSSLSGLQKITTVGGNIEIVTNPGLTSLIGLDNLVSAGGLRLYENTALTSVSSLSSLTAVENEFGIQYCIALTSLNGLEHLTTVGRFYIYQNYALTSLSPLENLTSVMNLEISSNPLLTNLSGLDGLTSVGGGLLIENNDALTSLTGLEQLASSGTIYIQENDVLTNLSSLSGLQSVGAPLWPNNNNGLKIDNNAALTNLNGLENLQHIGGYLSIWNNVALTSLTGLENLMSVDENLVIYNNDALTSLSSLESLSFVNLSISIWGNNSLPHCAVFAVCNQLLNDPESIYISDNAPGCDNPAEVAAQCHSIPVLADVRFDNNGNCQSDPSDTPVSDVQIQLKGMAHLLLKQTGTDGRLQFNYLEDEPFSMYLTQFPTDHWGACQDPILLDPNGSSDTLKTTFLLSPLTQCPELTIHLGMPSFFRGCLVTSDMEVSAQNSGAVIAQGVKIAVVLPTVLELTASAPPVEAQTGDTLYFDLGNLAPFDKATVLLTVRTKCDTFLMGQTLCIETFGTLDNACPNTLPAFSEIKLSAKCVGDSLVRFTIKNIGDAPTQAPHQYTIFHNESPMDAVSFILDVQQNLTVDVPADGATYRMEATKFDDGSLTAVAIENCRELTPGLITAFWFDDGPPEYDFDCRQVIGSYDPNLKSAIPTGAGPNYTITSNRSIQYTIDFQNTGTDTAYRVLLRDVLPSGFELNTFRPGYASHPCTWEIRGNTLDVLFFPIALPDSNINEPASHGFFTFDIDQKPDLPDGTYFQNTASIIFDFNPPIITNTVYHTIGKLSVAADEPQPYAALWQVAGNPTRDAATFSALTFIAGEKRFELYDASGRPVRTIRFSGQTFDFQRDALPDGMYFFRIGDEQGRWFTGKIVVLTP